MSKPRTWTKDKVLKIADALGLDTKVENPIALGLETKVENSIQKEKAILVIKNPTSFDEQGLSGYNQLWSWLTEDGIKISAGLNALHVELSSLQQQSTEKTEQTNGPIDLTKLIKKAKKHGLTVKQCDFQVQILKEWNNVDQVLPFSDMAKALSKASIKFSYGPALGGCYAIIIPVKVFGIAK